MFCLHLCVYYIHAWFLRSPEEGTGSLAPDGCQLWSLWIKCGSSRRAASVPNCWVISLVLTLPPSPNVCLKNMAPGYNLSADMLRCMVGPCPKRGKQSLRRQNEVSKRYMSFFLKKEKKSLKSTRPSVSFQRLWYKNTFIMSLDIMASVKTVVP